MLLLLLSLIVYFCLSVCLSALLANKCVHYECIELWQCIFNDWMIHGDALHGTLSRCQSCETHHNYRKSVYVHCISKYSKWFGEEATAIFYRKVHSLKWTTRIIIGYCNQHFGNFEQ